MSMAQIPAGLRAATDQFVAEASPCCGTSSSTTLVSTERYRTSVVPSIGDVLAPR